MTFLAYAIAALGMSIAAALIWANVIHTRDHEDA